MGPDISIERSPSGPPKIKPFLVLTESESEFSDRNYFLSEVGEENETLLTTRQAQLLWKNDSLEKFSTTLEGIENDGEFDRLDNKLLSALKTFSRDNPVYCSKCKTMTNVTRKGKTNKTYQFVCGSHTLSASQILSTLPDNFILTHLPMSPRHVFNETLSWIGRDDLSPELTERVANRNAVKRYSAYRSPMKGSEIIPPSQNTLNEVLTEMKAIKNEIKKLKEANRNLSEINDRLVEQNELLKGENLILRKYLNEPKPTEQQPSNTKDYPTFADIAGLNKPTRKENKRRPTEIVTGNKPQVNETPALKVPFSPLKLIFFKGCKRSSPGEYRRMFSEIGIHGRTVRDITFLTDDIVQLTVYESEINEIKSKIEGLSEDVKLLPNFDPCLGESYKDYGSFTNEQVQACYFALMKKSAERVEKASVGLKSLKRTAAFLAKLVESKTTNFEPTRRKPRTFVLGDFYEKSMPDMTDASQ